MRKGLRLTIIILTLVVLVTAGFIGFGVWHSSANTPTFAGAGYILQGDTAEVKQLTFSAGSAYADTLSGQVRFEGTDGSEHTVDRQSFVHLEGGSTMALSDGVLLDFADLTDNFINNYYIQAGLEIARAGEGYTAQTTAGTMQFGEHLWKLAEDLYIIESPSLKVTLGNEDVREVEDFVQISVSPDGIVYLLTQDNVWMTISENCCVETAGGVKVYPVTQLVDDGTYKLSLAKLSVSMDDAIVLSEDETRRQIVPELNIVGVDGEDGKSGQNGEDGEAGEEGEDGEAGENGIAGEVGMAGEAGVAGNDGIAAAEGGSGADGQGGQTGDKGQQGLVGNAGNTGNTGDTGGTGNTGNTGSTGGTGGTGGKGTPGANAVLESSTNNAIPTMTITDWRVTANSLKGTIKVSDLSEMLMSMTGKVLQYPGKVTITNVKSGAVIPCYEAESDAYDISNKEPEDTAFERFYIGDGSLVYFSTMGAPLEADTEYKLSVTAYYTTTDEVGLVYSREFISRSFYTDSTGVNLSYLSATSDSLTFDATLSESYKGSIGKVQVYLLTPQQAEDFSVSKIQSGSTDYAAMAEISGADFEEESSQKVTLTGKLDTPLEHDMRYVARVYVETTAGLQTLTPQRLDVKTLKLSPSKVEAEAVPTAMYNRLTGGFEVFRPAISDPDGGVAGYIYTAYRLENGEYVQAMKRTVGPTAGEPVEFRLPGGQQYQFGVEVEFFDNEKTVCLDLGRSEPIIAEGDTMPKVTLTPRDQGLDYDKFAGTLSVDLGKNSHVITGSPDKPLKVELFADQLSSGGNAIELVQRNQPMYVNGKDDAMGTVTLVETTTNRLSMELDLRSLYKNTNYAITLSGWLDVGDGNGPQLRAIGTVTFKTYDTVTLVAAFTAPTSAEAGSASMSRKLKLSVQEDTTGQAGYEARAAYARNRLIGGSSAETDPCGQVTVVLYHGVSITDRVQIAQKNFTEKEDLEALFGDGRVITEADFGSPTIDPGSGYTLKVTLVSDSSYKDATLGYVNTYDQIINPSGTTAGVTQPPDLLRDPAKGVNAQPIYNKDAALYGAAVSKELPEDAVIGFSLSATYDNVQRIGTKVTYYAYEFNAFRNALEAFNPNTPLQDSTPLKEMRPLMTMSQPISASSDDVPKVAILFGGTKTVGDDESAEGGPTFHNNHMVYYAGNAQYADSLASGMGRGFRYLFAYEVEYQVSGSGEGSADSETVTRTYPYDHGDYADFQKRYYGVTYNGITYGSKTYILHSGMCNAPLILPDFHTYVEKSYEGDPSDGIIATASGSLTLHYTWRDAEYRNNPTDPGSKMVVTGVDNPNCTRIYFQSTSQDGDEYTLVGDPANQVQGQTGWYEVVIPYSHTELENAVLRPSVDVKKYRLNYSEYVGEGGDEANMPLGPFPVDWSWHSEFTQDYANSVTVQRVDNYDENNIMFWLVGEGADTLAQRAVAMELTFDLKDAQDTSNRKTFLVPIVYDISSGTHCGRVTTGQLGSDYLSVGDDIKTYVVSDVKLYYDNGAQGWSLASGELPFSLQNIQNETEGNKAALGDYVGAKPSGSAVGSGSLFRLADQTVELTAALRTAINAESPERDSKAVFSRTALTTNYNAGTSYLYPTQGGVDSGNTRDVEQLAGSYVTPKGISVYTLKFQNGKDTSEGVLESLTPTVDYNYIAKTTSTVFLRGLKVEGLAGGGGTIFMRLYPTEDNALALDNKYSHEISIEIGSDGAPVNGEEATLIDKLQSGETYWIALLYKKAGTGEEVLLLDKDTSGKAVYKVTTSEFVTINVKKMEYVNNGYLDKYLSVEYTLSQILNLRMQVDIYSSEAAAEEGTAGDVLTHQQMLDSHLLTMSEILSDRTNELTIQLEPRMARDMLDPGMTYYMKFTTFEDGNAVGQTVKPFTLTEIGSYGALVYVRDAASDSITFKVTITDPQYTLMGRDRDEGALYAVRFTDASGRRIYTRYDDMVYPVTSGGSLDREFILSAETLDPRPQPGIQTNTEYQLYVYALPDEDHNGVITLEDKDYTWEEMFQQTEGEDGTTRIRFLNQINSFWNPDYSNRPEKDLTEFGLLIAQKRQMTTTQDNWLLNESHIYTTKVGTQTVNIVFAESIGLIKPDGSQVFNRIDWQVQGTDYNGMPVKAKGTALRSEGDDLIQRGKDSGNDIFFYQLPYDLSKGTYTFVLQLREQADDPAAAYTVTVVSGIS